MLPEAGGRSCPVSFDCWGRNESVDIDFVKESAAPVTYFNMRLSDVVITGVRTNASTSEDNVTEFVTFQFARLEWTWTPDGTPPVHSCWDLVQNQAC